MYNHSLRKAILFSVSMLAWCGLHSADQTRGESRPKRNLIIFIADGLRNGSVNETDAPTLLSLRKRGAYFQNSHSLFPTFTTANASAIATGHYLGDTGDFSNVVFTHYPMFETGNFARAAGTVTPFLEDDQRLGDLDDHFYGNYLNEPTLLTTARKHGYATAVVGKLGPVAIQDIEEARPHEGYFPTPEGIVIDDATGREDSSGHQSGLPLQQDLRAELQAAKLDVVAPDRSNGCGKTDTCNNGYSGDGTHPGTSAPNTHQQQYFVGAVTKAILPLFLKNNKPFVLVFWSRDPDGTQHNQGDSLNKLTPGINGATSRSAVKNADNNLKEILEFLDSTPKLQQNTDLIVTSDHGFATISRHEIDNAGNPTGSYSSKFKYNLSSSPGLEIPEGYLPTGFLAIDLAHFLDLKLYDPDRPNPNAGSPAIYQEVDPKSESLAAIPQRPLSGNALIGDVVHRKDGSDAKVIVAANGGSDLIYVPDHDVNRVRAIVDFVSHQDYVGGIFVDTDLYGELPGALPLRAIGLTGSTLLPPPALVVSFKAFYSENGNLQSAVQVSDTFLQEGQGMHGGFRRDSTFNNMAAIGPDFKVAFVDPSPVSNADIAITAASILGLELPAKGCLRGRVLREALKGGPPSIQSTRKTLASSPANGHRTVLHYQQATTQLYFDDACFVDTGSAPASCQF